MTTSEELFGDEPRGATKKPRMWEKMTAAWPDYEGYQEKTDREIPVVVLGRA